MSIPFVEISCERCEFRGASLVLRGEPVYRHDGREIPLWRSLGWCPDCAGIRAVESPPGEDDLERMRGHVRLIDVRIETEKTRARARRRGPIRWLRLPARSAHLDELRRTRDAALESLQTAEWVHYLFRKRRARPRCLDCGSQAATVFEHALQPTLPARDGSSSEPETTELQHPGCGGRFRVRQAEMLDPGNPERARFDIEGNRFMKASDLDLSTTIFIFLALMFANYSLANYQGAEIIPEHPVAGQSVTIRVFDDPGCFPLGPDTNGISHDLSVDGYLIELDLNFGGVCFPPTGQNIEYDFEIGSLDSGSYQVRLYDFNGITFPAEPTQLELLEELSFSVGEEPVVVSSIGILGRVLLIGLLCISGYFAHRIYLCIN